MSVTPIALDYEQTESRPIDLVRLATVGMAVTCAVWRAAVAAGLPAAAWPYIAVDLLLAVAQGVWTWRFSVAPTRAAYVVGCVIVSIPLGVSMGLSVAAGAGAFGAPLALGLAEAVAFVLNLVLLGLTLLGALELPAGRVVRGYATAAIACAALGITLLVGGLTHSHPAATPHWVLGAHGQRVLSASPVFFCHLV